VLDELRAIAPVTAVRGNVDAGAWAAALPIDTLVSIDGADIYMLHSVYALPIDPKAAGVSAVISGHTHQPLVEIRDDVLFLNPGSAGPRRFSLPVSIGFLRIRPNTPIEAWTQSLDVRR